MERYFIYIGRMEWNGIARHERDYLIRTRFYGSYIVITIWECPNLEFNSSFSFNLENPIRDTDDPTPITFPLEGLISQRDNSKLNAVSQSTQYF